jgi:hypothetical protein
MARGQKTTLSIGNVVFTIAWDGKWPPYEPQGIYRRFISQREPEVRLDVHSGIPRYSPRPEDLLFDSQSHWKLFRSDQRTIITLESPVISLSRYCMAVFDREFRHGDVYVADEGYGMGGEQHTPDVIDHTLWQILTVCLMSRRQGLMVHVCGVERDGRGYLFAGNSGHGKSTMAALWSKESSILNDDRMVIRRREHEIAVYGTPWHGDHESGANGGIELDKCFFLSRGTSNQALPVSGARASAMLLARSFPPLWYQEGMRFTLDLISAVVSKVRCYELSFVPTEEIVEFVTCME